MSGVRVLLDDYLEGTGDGAGRADEFTKTAPSAFFHFHRLDLAIDDDEGAALADRNAETAPLADRFIDNRHYSHVSVPAHTLILWRLTVSVCDISLIQESIPAIRLSSASSVTMIRPFSIRITPSSSRFLRDRPIISRAVPIIAAISCWVILGPDAAS